MQALAFVLILFSYVHAHSSWIVEQRLNSRGNLLSVESIKYSTQSVPEEVRLLRNIPEHMAEGFAHNVYFQKLLLSDRKAQFYLKHYGNQRAMFTSAWPGSEMRTIVSQGPSENRIDLTIVGDGYTNLEREKFFQDVDRMVRDMFEGKTFASYLPLFNVHAVFVPSAQSGLTDVKKVNTALGLYRSPKGSKRAVMPGNTAAIERAIRLAPDSDYPILIANDDYYGGLGGRYAITTRSLTSGTVVLRHELGHNFGEVGEEYDGGSVYSGANFSRSSQVPWMHWVKGALQIFESHFLGGEYIWKNLKASPFKFTFNMPGGNYLFDIDISTVGWATESDVDVLVNGQRQILDGLFTVDRSFFKIKNLHTLPEGKHQLVIQERKQDGDNVLAFANLYAHPHNLNKTKGFVGAYNNFNYQGSMVGYRPTFDTCLMRDMRSTNFCVVDQENMWIRFLREVSLIDDVEIKATQRGSMLKVLTPPLNSQRGRLTYKWYHHTNGQWSQVGTNSPSFQTVASGQYMVEVEFTTSEVKKPGIRFVSRKEVNLN